MTKYPLVRPFLARLALALTVVVLAACATAPVDPPSSAALDQLLAASHESQLSTDIPDESVFLAMSPAMEEFVRVTVQDSASADQALAALFDAFRYNHNIEYQDHATLTAAEAFRQQRANCLAFSAMFIAMARAAGLDARFQEVDVPPTWGSTDQQTLVQYRHVNVVVRLNRREEAVIDLRADRYSDSYPRRILSDRQALAHYYSNLSMDELLGNDLLAAQGLAYAALVVDGSQSFVWNNMGIILRRQGQLELAETSYRQALALDRHDWSAMSNLAFIFEYRGEAEEAARLRALSHDTKLGNPYYRYALAQQAFHRQDYPAALLQLDEAIKRHRHEARFFYLRGMSHWQLGAAPLAEAEMQQAISLATDDSSRVRYEQQLAEWHTSDGHD